MHIHDSGGGLVRTHHRVPKINVPVSGVGDRVFRNFAQILRLRIGQILQRLRRSLFVQSVVVNCPPHHGQVALERRFPGTLHRFDISARSDADQNRDDGDNDHQLKQREPASRRTASLCRNRLLGASNLPGAHRALRAGSLLGATSLHILSHRWPWLVISSTHQIHFSLPSFVNQDHPTRRAIPNPTVRSSGLRGCAARIVFSCRRPRPPSLLSPTFPSRAGNPRCPLPRESCWNRPSLCSDRSRRASASGCNAATLLSYERWCSARSAAPRKTKSSGSCRQ